MRIGDLVMVDLLHAEALCLVISPPRLSYDCEIPGTMYEDRYEVVEVLLSNGEVELVTTDEVMGTISESR